MNSTTAEAAEPVREFTDTNVLVYAFDSSSGTKHDAARLLVQRLWRTGSGCVSTQVLQEFFVVVTQRVTTPMREEDAVGRIREFAAWQLFTPTADDVLEAIELHKEMRINFWDAMIVQGALATGCGILWTEDLRDGQIMRGVRVRNPFKASTTGEPWTR